MKKEYSKRQGCGASFGVPHFSPVVLAAFKMRDQDVKT